MINSRWRFYCLGGLLLTTVLVFPYGDSLAGKGGKGGGGSDSGPSAVEENPAIAFVTVTSGRDDVVIASADLSSEIVLTKTIQSKHKGRYTHLFGSPVWTPDGSMVAFAALDLTDPNYGRDKLYVAKADGSQVRLVRDFRSRPTLHRLNYTGGLSWSPSGAEIVYEGYHAIVAIDVANGDIAVLLDGFYTGDPVGEPVLSPDINEASGYQGMVAMVAYDGSVDEFGNPHFDIFAAPIQTDANGRLLPIDATSIVNVTDSPGTTERLPSWSPDGSALACFHSDGTNEWLAVIDTTSGQESLIWSDYATIGQGEDRATWSSDGSFLIYRTEFSGIDRFDLSIILPYAGAEPINYTNTPNRREVAPAWNPRWDPAGAGGI